MQDPVDFPELAEETVAQLRATMIEGLETHEPEIWKREGSIHHVAHALTHFLDFLTYGKAVDLEHALTRSAFALACHRRGVDRAVIATCNAPLYPGQANPARCVLPRNHFGMCRDADGAFNDA